jgi:diguanylate cyclase (GGDEF)-like protein
VDQYISNEDVSTYFCSADVVILPYVSHQSARDIAERIRMGFAQATVTEDQGQATQPVSASIGVAYCPEDGMDVEVLIRKADEMMYLAKQLGKNQTCFTSDY